jgi:type I restriction enzyme S subunit
MGAGVRQGLNFDELKKLRITLPPINEQNKIVKYIEEKTNQIDTLISKSTQAIELLKERRTALISAVVTGKIDIQNT